MRPPKHYLHLIPDEYRLLLYALNRFRNKLIREERFTDAVDELIVKVMK